MSYDITIASSCKDSPSLWSRLRRLISTGSRRAEQITSKSNAILASLAATGLVLASAGFGAVYAWSTGSQHGTALACLMVLMAVALELAKPLSVAAAFSAFRSWAIVRGAALAVLAAVAVSYSLTAELSLMATSRGDVIATREASIKAASGVEQEAMRARDRYERAWAELDALPVTRPASEIQAEIDGLLLTPGADGCEAINGKVTREICPQVAGLRAEKARADRRAELEQILAEPVPAAAASNSGQQAVSKPDPGASALSTYLGVLGIAIVPAVLSEWLVLVPVLALEVGSAFAMLLVQSMAPRQGVDATFLAPKRKDEPAAKAAAFDMVPVVQAGEVSPSEDQPAVREEVKKRLVGQLKASGGSKASSERGLAKLIGTSKPTVRRAINGLVMAGVLAAEASRNGTVLRLLT